MAVGKVLKDIVVMSLLNVLLTAVTAVIVFHYTTLEHTLAPAEVSVPSLRRMEEQLGSSRDLSHRETRIAYLGAMKWGVQALQEEKGFGAEEDQARRCHLFRWRARLWARSRDSEAFYLFGIPVLPSSLVPLALGVRDIMTHIPLSGWMVNPIRSLRDAGACLVQDETRPFCPSLEFLSEKHNGNWANVIEGCGRTNTAYNKIVEGSP